MKKHGAHLVVTFVLAEGVAPLEALMAFTSLLAAVADSTASVGVYWGNAGATHTKEFFLSIADEHQVNPRILLWNGFSRSGEKDGNMSFLSYGMNQLALPDLYMVCDTKDAVDHCGRFFDLLSYLADRGKPIPAGDTIGSSEEEKILVEYVKSPADKKNIVMKVVF